MARSALPPANCLQYAVVTFKSSDSRSRQYFYVRQTRNPIDEIPRHPRLQAAPAHQEPHLGSVAREIDRRLSGRVSGAHQGNFLSGAQLRFKRRSPIVNACSFELLNSGIEAAIDRVSFELHDLSKRAKDLASAAVFLSLVLCGAIWLTAACSRFLA